MARVGPGEFVRYEAGHTLRTGLVVIPLLLIELGTGVPLAFDPPSPGSRTPPLLGLALQATDSPKGT